MDILQSLPKVGPKTITKLNKLGIFKPADLLYHFPNRYIDFSHHTAISQSEPDTNVTITGKINSFQNIFTRHGKNIQKATVIDNSGQIDLLWFNQPYLTNNLHVGDVFSFAGTVSLYLHKKTIIAPVFGQYNTGKIIAVYPETAGLKSGWFRQTISLNLKTLLQNIYDPFSATTLKKYHLLPLSTSLIQIHQPASANLLAQAQLRLGLDEILALQTQSYLKKQTWAAKTPHQIFTDFPKINTFIKKLPFKLTASQLNTWNEIKADLLSETPMNRLLEGDVGSGKTIVAILACLLAHYNKVSSLIVVPTEILAKQHHQTLTSFLDFPIKILTGKSKLTKFSPGSIIIATHAAIYQKKSLENHVGLLVIDEQHKFGVAQRTFLTNSLHPPHCLTMTATPIPRTISLTVLGNLDLSQIDTLPLGRLPVKTFLVPEIKYTSCYRWLSDQITSTGQQAFIVCPFIEPSETLISVKSAKVLFEHLRTEIFPNLKLGLIHGKTPTANRQKVLRQFAENKINILVTTPIIEVGIDFPNATTIIIQSADRFGLAQLHQLRGRVGRGSDQSFCYLFSESDSDKANKRLEMLTRTHDGQKIAEYDLKTRGPGEAFSFIQHGFPSLKIASFSDYKLISLGQLIIKDLSSTNFDLKKLIKSDPNNLSSTN
jgi:ATP-dependent DNA helicase RecG